jgi:heat shock protein HtpX
MTTFRDLIAENKRKTYVLVVLFILFVVLIAFVFAAAILYGYDSGMPVGMLLQRSLGVGALAAIVAAIVTSVSFFEGDQLVLGINRAVPLQKQQDPQLYNVVEEMAIAAGVPMPKVYLIHDPALNAFATGRDPQHASVAITSGLRNQLNREELQGVIAHEIAHVRNYDIRLMLMLAVLIGTIVMLCDFFWNVLRFGPRMDRGGGSDRNRDNKDGKGGNPLMLLVLVLAIVLAILAPLLARLIQLAVSRQREYLADSSAVELTRNPIGLANALRKLEADPNVLRTANRGDAHLFIVNPIKTFQSWANTMFASHPPTPERIRRLLALVGEKNPSNV